MKIFFDARLMFYAGVGRYQREILSELFKIDNELFVYILGDKIKILEYIKKFNLNAANFYIINSTIKKYTFKEQLLLIKIFKSFRSNVDVFFLPHFNIPFLYLPPKSIVVVHDLTFFHFPNYFGRVRTFLAKIVLKNILRKANVVITVSNYVKNDIINMFGTKTNNKLNSNILENKIKTVYLGYSKKFKPQTQEDIINFKNEKGLTNFFLYCGNRKKHKNIIRLIKAFKNAKQELADKEDLKLILIGKRFSKDKKPDFIDHFLAKNNIKDVLSIEWVSDRDLNLYYAACNAFVFVSLSEGFGLAPIEALAAGAPVLILANNSSLPEIFKDAALYVNPYDIKEISNAIKKTMFLGPDNTNEVDLALKQKNEILNYFSYEKCAKEIYNVMMQIK